MIKVEKYSNTDHEGWNLMVNNSRNGTFLHNRNFMEYHSDRFSDFSLIVLENSILVAIFPANITDGTVISHGGLTYGGLLFPGNVTLRKSILYFSKILKFLFSNKIAKLIYKPSPDFYHKVPSGELDFVLFLTDARLIRRDTSAILDLSLKLPFQERRRRGIKKAAKLNINIRQDTGYATFWNNILIPNLQNTYKVKPVHSLAEIEQLAYILPENIKQFSAYVDDEIVAGCTIFETEIVAHTQYISASEFGKSSGAIDYLFSKLINDVYSGKKYFSFGSSNGIEPGEINFGLIEWKEGFGARTICNDFYEIETAKYKILENYTLEND
jgi:hypothetical protein